MVHSLWRPLWGKKTNKLILYYTVNKNDLIELGHKIKFWFQDRFLRHLLLPLLAKVGQTVLTYFMFLTLLRWNLSLYFLFDSSYSLTCRSGELSEETSYVTTPIYRPFIHITTNNGPGHFDSVPHRMSNHRTLHHNLDWQTRSFVICEKKNIPFSSY